MTHQEISKLRLQNQHLSAGSFQTAAELVYHFGAVQGQEYEQTKWGLGIRLPHLNNADIEKEIESGKIYRTHLLRPTWHLVHADDILWMQALTAERVQAINGFMYRKLELTDKILDRAAGIICKSLDQVGSLTRAELSAILSRNRINTDGFRLVYIMMNAELRGLIANGKRAGKQHTYALLNNNLIKANDDRAEKATADKVTLDKAILDKLTADKAAADKAIADKLPADKATADKATADKASASIATADKATADRATADKAHRADKVNRADKTSEAGIRVVNRGNLKPNKTDKEEGLSKLAKRYFTSRGPATAKDFSTWSGLIIADCQLGINLNGQSFNKFSFEDEVYYHIPSTGSVLSNISNARARASLPGTTNTADNTKALNKDLFLLPVYDELIMGYKDRKSIMQNYKKGLHYKFDCMILHQGQVIGTYKRTIKLNTAFFEFDYFKTPDKKQKTLVESALKEFERFSGLKVSVLQG